MSEVDAWDTYQFGFGKDGDVGLASKQAYKIFMAHSKANDKSVIGWGAVGFIESLGTSLKVLNPEEAGRAGATALENEAVRANTVYNTYREGGHSVPVAAAGTAGMVVNDIDGASDLYEAGSGRDTNRVMATGDFKPTLTGTQRWTKGISGVTKAANVALTASSFATPGVTIDAAATREYQEAWGKMASAERAEALQAALPAGSKGRVTMAAGYFFDAEGKIHIAIASSEPGAYLRPSVAAAKYPWEKVATGIGDAETKLFSNFYVEGAAAGRPVCKPCQRLLDDAGIEVLSERK
jgi:hypothetical protein